VTVLAGSPPRPTVVLLVEDNLGDARLVRETLSDDAAFPHELVMVERLGEALAVLASRAVDVVLLDLTLPDASETRGVQRLTAAHPALPVVVLTGADHGALAIEVMQAGAQDYLVKGEMPARLISRSIRYAIERSRAEEAGRTLLRAQMEHAVAVAERGRLYSLLMQAPVAVCVIRSPSFVFELANARYLELVGRTDVVGKPIMEVFPEVAGQGVEQRLANVVATGEAFVGKEVSQRLDRSGELTEVIFDFVYAPMRGPEDAVEGVMVVATDVTDQVQARERVEQARRETERSEQRFQLLAEVTPQIIWSMAPDASDVYLSPRWHEYTGQPLELAFEDKWRAAVHPADYAEWVARWTEALTARAPWQMEYRLRRHDGDYRWYLGRSVPHFDSDGTVLRWYGASTDINDQRTAIRSRDDLLATVSHDLRGLLAPIMMAVDVLRLVGVADGARQLGAIQRAAARMEQLIRDLLDMASIESGHLSVDPAALVATDLVDEAIESIRAQAAAKHIELELDLALADLRVHCDRGRVLQVFANILGNAVKFTPARGKISVRGGLDGKFVKFAISDTGPGIEAAQLPFIFDRFWQAKATARAGTGLGLAICKGILQQHGGSIWAESELGVGTTFFFTLPIAPPDGG
jgi:PAS domain S-box-containing protein